MKVENATCTVLFRCGDEIVNCWKVTMGDDGTSGMGAFNTATFFYGMSDIVQRFTLAHGVVRGLLRLMGAQ